jgi:predicted phage tail protein
MTDGLVTVRLWGTLGQQFGHEHHFAIRTALEAFAALEANFAGFRRALVKFREYYVRCDGDFLDSRQIQFPVSKEIDIVPEVEGRAFAPLVGAIVGGLGFAAGTTAATIATILTYVVITALLIGVSILLAPKPKKKTDDRDKKESNALSGPDNIVGQGAAVPIIYGRCFVGSVVIAIGIETSDQIPPPDGGGGGGKGSK